MSGAESKPRVRTKFERTLFLGFVLVAVTLGAVSIGSLAATGQKLQALFERLWSQAGTDAVNRDLAFFARRYLEDLSASASTTLDRAVSDCPAGGAVPYWAAAMAAISRQQERNLMNGRMNISTSKLEARAGLGGKRPE